MSEANNGSFKAEMIAEIKKIQMELNDIKNDIEKNIEGKPAKKTTVKKKMIKKKPAKKTTVKKKMIKKKPAKKTTVKKKMIKKKPAKKTIKKKTTRSK